VNRADIRELIRKAQAAELAKEPQHAVELLQQAATALRDTDPARAASLLRQCTRLMPEREDLKEAAARAESAGEARPRKLALDMPQRGPVAADPTADGWCSFCCRPQGEVGPLVAGPAGAFICGRCIEGAAAILGQPLSTKARPVGTAAPWPVVAREVPTSPETPKADFIEAAVLLSKAVGWSLTEVRSLSEEERAKALEVLARGEPGPKKRQRRKP